jgi:hypothetical protein
MLPAGCVDVEMQLPAFAVMCERWGLVACVAAFGVLSVGCESARFFVVRKRCWCLSVVCVAYFCCVIFFPPFRPWIKSGSNL